MARQTITITTTTRTKTRSGAGKSGATITRTSGTSRCPACGRFLKKKG